MSALTEHLMDSIQYLKTKSEQLAAVVDTLTEDIKSLTTDNADLRKQRSQHLRMLKQRERRIDELLPLEEAADEQHIHLTEDLRETRRQLKDAKEWNEVSSKGLHTMIDTRDKKIAQLRLDLCDTQRQLKDTKELRLTPDHRDYWNEIHSKGLHTMTDDRDKEIAQLKEELETHKKMIEAQAKTADKQTQRIDYLEDEVKRKNRVMSELSEEKSKLIGKLASIGRTLND